MKLETALKRIPPPGAGCHPYLLVCANIAVREGLEEDEAVQQIHDAIPSGGRTVSEKEVRDTVRKSISDKLMGRGLQARPTHGNQMKSLRMTTPKMLEKFLHPKDVTLNDLYQASPIVFDKEDYKEQAATTLYHLFEPTDRIYIGDTRDSGKKQIYLRDVWINSLREGDPDCFPPHIIWNPLTGLPAKKADGEDSLRCDNAVASFKYVLVEFDSISIEIQLRFWAACKLPVAALVYSGSKSVHGVVRVKDIKTLDDWRHQIQQLMYKRMLTPLGVDGACSNASRLSRLPGAWREGKNAYQRLLYLNPNASAMNLEI